MPALAAGIIVKYGISSRIDQYLLIGFLGAEMTPQPKRKHSQGRRDRKRAHHALQYKNLVQCSNCGEMRLPHTVCQNCGHYKGREIISVDEG